MTRNNLSPNAALSRRRRVRAGQTLVEYALIIAVISIVAVSTLITMSGQISGTFTTIDRQVAIAGNGGPAAAPPARGG